MLRPVGSSAEWDTVAQRAKDRVKVTTEERWDDLINMQASLNKWLPDSSMRYNSVL
jgi:hypothetical protein